MKKNLVFILFLTSITFVAGCTGFKFNSRSGVNSEDIKIPEQAQSEIKTLPDGTKYLIHPSKILSGGPPKDGIPSIDNPKFLPVEEANKYLNDNDVVLGINHKGVQRAYPLSILNWHEIVNDNLAGDPILITYCPLCRTGIAFERKINNQEVKFGTSGKLFNSNLVMYDRATDSYWLQLTGQAIVGELAGLRLKQIPIDTLRWKDWKELFPNTQVLSRDTGFFRDYNTNPYGNYDASSAIFFPTENEDSRLHPKAIIYPVVLDNVQKAYPEDELEKAKLVNDIVGENNLLIILDPRKNVVSIFDRTVDNNALEFELRNSKLFDNSNSEWTFDGEAISGIHDGKRLKQIPSSGQFWFSWIATYPRADIFKA